MIQKIDKHYYQSSLAIYFADLLGTLALFFISFLTCLNTEWPLAIVPFVLSSVFLYRAGAFIHELTHQSRNPRFKVFYHFWNLTAGALSLVAGPRFFHPHLVHHQNGIFGTPADPQYPLLRRDPALAVFMLITIPFIMPIYSLILVITSSFRYMKLEEWVEDYFTKRGNPTGGILPEEYRNDVVWYGRYYLILFALYAWFFPETLPIVYGIEVGGWMLTTLRIPMEHALRQTKPTSGPDDQMADSYTIEASLAMLLQPLGLRFHTAHHMYPGVPYHNLRALHEELKQTVPGYRDKVVPFWRTAVHGPGQEAIMEKPPAQ